MTGNGADRSIIRLENLSRTFQVGDEQVHALVDVSERVEKGEHVAIMGPSGSGKSTLLNILGCLDRPSGGRYYLDSRDVSGLDSPTLTQIRRNQIGFVFQFFHLIPRLTAAGNVELPMIFAGIPRAERHERVARAIADVGLTQRADHLPEQLSGGERQRIALARATIMKPSILLADEPTGNLDTKSGSAVLDIIEKLNDEGLTLLVVTHDPKVAQRADRIIVLVDGRVAKRVKDGQIREVMEILTAE
jgi:putative ABC transport system ATP-binding protein